MRWIHITYGSFRGTAGRGGWKVGSWSAQATKEDLQLIAEVAPTHIETVTAFDDFITSEEIDALPRRFEYRPMLNRALIMQSVPAGKDATGRPGNIFTHAVIDADLGSPLESIYPISFYRSADLLSPFRVAAVNEAELSADLGEPRTGPMADLSLSWMMVDSMFGNRRQTFYQLQDALQTGERAVVLVLNNTNEAAYWIQALSSTLTPNEARRLLHYSTFERAATLPTPNKSGEACSLFIVPGNDRALLAEKPGIVIIDPEKPVEQKAEPKGSWARMTAALYTDGFDPDEIVAGLIRANEKLDSSQAELARFGDGLARFTRSEFASDKHPVRVIADQHLFGTTTAQPARAAEPVEEQPSTNEILAHASAVIHTPRHAVESQDWISLRRMAGSRRWISNMSEQAINSIEKLHDSPATELVAYLDFLLKTELATSINAADSHFRSSFSDFPAMNNWRRIKFTGGEHPKLKELLVDAERDARNRPAAELILDQIMQNLNKDRTLDDVSAWINGAEGKRLVAGINQGLPVRTGRNYFLSDLLRVYFGVAVNSDDDVYQALTKLAKDSATRYVESRLQTGRSATLRTFEKFGENFARSEAPEFLSTSSEIDYYIEVLKRDAINTRVSRNNDVNTIFNTVAQAIIRAVGRRNSGKELQL